MKITDQSIEKVTFEQLKPGDIYVILSEPNNKYLVIKTYDDSSCCPLLRSVSLPEFVLQSVNPDHNAELKLCDSELTIYR